MKTSRRRNVRALAKWLMSNFDDGVCVREKETVVHVYGVLLHFYSSSNQSRTINVTNFCCFRFVLCKRKYFSEWHTNDMKLKRKSGSYSIYGLENEIVFWSIEVCACVCWCGSPSQWPHCLLDDEWRRWRWLRRQLIPNVTQGMG